MSLNDTQYVTDELLGVILEILILQGNKVIPYLTVCKRWLRIGSQTPSYRRYRIVNIVGRFFWYILKPFYSDDDEELISSNLSKPQSLITSTSIPTAMYDEEKNTNIPKHQRDNAGSLGADHISDIVERDIVELAEPKPGEEIHIIDRWSYKPTPIWKNSNYECYCVLNLIECDNQLARYVLEGFRRKSTRDILHTATSSRPTSNDDIESNTLNVMNLEPFLWSDEDYVCNVREYNVAFGVNDKSMLFLRHIMKSTVDERLCPFYLKKAVWAMYKAKVNGTNYDLNVVFSFRKELLHFPTIEEIQLFGQILGKKSVTVYQDKDIDVDLSMIGYNSWVHLRTTFQEVIAEIESNLEKCEKLLDDFDSITRKHQTWESISSKTEKIPQPIEQSMIDKSIGEDDVCIYKITKTA